MSGPLSRPAAAPVLAAWLLLTAVTSTPHLVNALAPPPGQAFVGFFLSWQDCYNYLGFVRQAESGDFLFRNRVLGAEHAPVLVNLEWWAAGRLSALLGRSPLLAFRLLGVLASLALLALVDCWLRTAGLPTTHRFAALLLIGFGGGLGGLRLELLGPPAWRSLDLVAGLFPFIEIVANPHFVTGTALLAGGLLAFANDRPLLGLALGTALALVRPYDAVLLGAVRGLAVLLAEPRRDWISRLLPLAGMAPAAAYLYFVFYHSTGFSTFFYQRGRDATPLLDLAVALGPPALLAAALWRPSGDPRQRRFALHLAAWAAIGLALGVLQPVDFFLQFLVGIGVPLLGLLALGLSRFPPPATLLAAALLCSTPWVAWRTFLRPEPLWSVGAERLAAARALGERCQPGDRFLGPRDISLYALAFSDCDPWATHLAPERREAERDTFYSEMQPAARRALLDQACIRLVLLPPVGADPVPFLGPGSGFRLQAVAQARGRALGIYQRTSSCPDRPRD